MKLNAFVRCFPPHLALAAAGLLGTPTQAASWCTPVQIEAQSGLSVMPAAQASSRRNVYVEPTKIESGLFLLGMDGSRVEVEHDLMPSPKMINGRMQLPDLWSDKVDWSAYYRSDLALQPVPALVFEADEQGRWHLCRIEKRELSQAYRERVLTKLDASRKYELEKLRVSDPLPDWLEAPQAGDTVASGIEQLIYDQHGRVLGYEALKLNDQTGRWEAGEAQCVAYDASGAVSRLSHPRSGRCDQVLPADAVSIHVHDASGRLLRSIETDRCLEAHDGEYKFVAHPMALIYGQDGVIKARYREDQRRHGYRLPESPQLSECGSQSVAVISAPSGLGNLSIRDPSLAPSMGWRIVALPKGSSNLNDYQPGGSEQLAQGKIGKFGRMLLTAAEQQSIWRAMHQDDQIVVLQSSGAIVLAPGVTASQWQACLDSNDHQAGSCP